MTSAVAVGQVFNADEFEALAKERLPIATYCYVAGGAGAERTLRENRAAFARWVFRPRVLVDTSGRDLATTVLGRKISLPVLVAPFSLQCLLDPEGEVATARAATAVGTIMVVSMGSTRTLEDVAAAAGCALWFQPYLCDDRGLMEEMLRRAEASGYAAICLTLDSPVGGWREASMRTPVTLPPGVTWANMPKHLGQPSRRNWLAGGDTWDWDELDWLRSRMSLPLVLKGILNAEDARLAVEHGAAAVIVSNHGGRQLDDSISAIDALPEIAEAIGKRSDVLVDGGVRRGTDVLKALALGARAVLVGRAAAWGVAVGGQAGVERVFELIRGELSSAMAIAGVSSTGHVPRELLAPRATTFSTQE